MLDEIKNNNIKRLIKKLEKYPEFDDAPEYLRHNLLMELRFAKLIMETPLGFYIIWISDSEINFSFHVFTDLEEFKKCGHEDFKPEIFELFDFENFNNEDFLYFGINECFNKIPMNKIWHEIDVEKSFNGLIEKYSHHYSLTDTKNLIKSFNNDNLIKYLNERKYIRSYNLLFKTIRNSVLFTEIDVQNQSDSVLLASQVESYFRIDENNYITTFTDIDSFKKDYFSVVDWIELIYFVIRHQINGIKIDIGTKQIKLPRYQLLKHFDVIREVSYEYNLTNTFKYIFKVDDYVK